MLDSCWICSCSRRRMYRHGKNRTDRICIEELNTCIYSNSRRETRRARGAGSDLEGGQNRRRLARIARPRRVLESRSRRANGTVFQPKCAHKTRNYIIVLCEMANRAAAADARRKSVDDRHTPAPPRCSIVSPFQSASAGGSPVGVPMLILVPLPLA